MYYFTLLTIRSLNHTKKTNNKKNTEYSMLQRANFLRYKIQSATQDCICSRRFPLPSLLPMPEAETEGQTNLPTNVSVAISTTSSSDLHSAAQFSGTTWLAMLSQSSRVHGSEHPGRWSSYGGSIILVSLRRNI